MTHANGEETDCDFQGGLTPQEAATFEAEALAEADGVDATPPVE